MDLMSVKDAAKALGVSGSRVRQILASGQLKGAMVSGVWVVDGNALALYRAVPRLQQRRWDVATSWAALFALSGQETPWLHPSTLSRLRGRLRQLDVERLAALVATRTTTHRFRSANVAKAQADLLATGRAATDVLAALGSGLLPDERRVCGYVTNGTVDEYARAHFMSADVNGPDVLYEATWPVEVKQPLPAVVAADLARSADTRERSAGITALDRLLDDYRSESWK